MIIQEIPITPQPFTKNIINVNLNGQQCQITLDSINDFDYYSLTILDYYTVFNMNFNGNPIVRGAFCRSRSNLTPFAMPRNTTPQFQGAIFFYSPYTQENPKYPDFGTRYKLIFSDTFAFRFDAPNRDEFILALNKLFKA